MLVVKGGSNFFEYVGRISRKRNVIGSCCVVSVYADDNSNIYVGTDNDGFYVLDPDYKLIHHYDCNVSGSIVPKVPLAFCEDSHGRLWTGGYQGGLVYLDRKTNTWHRYNLSAASGSSGDDFSSVYSIVEDKDRQNLWVSASGVGLFRINANTLAGRLYGIKNSTFQHDFSTDQLCNAWVVSMMLSSDKSKLYIGTYSGFSCLDLNTESFVSTYGVNCFLEGYVVNSICEGRDGYFWIGTTDGLFKFDADTRKFKRYGTADGLSGTSISGIACDTAGNMWISSKSGISCLDAQTGKFVNYDSYDGLYSNEFMPDAVWNAKNGRILFGSVNGVIGFNPFARRNRVKSLNIRIVNFFVDNVSVARGSKSGGNDIVDTAVIFARKFHLAHFDNSFEVEYSALDFECFVCQGRLRQAYARSLCRRQFEYFRSLFRGHRDRFPMVSEHVVLRVVDVAGGGHTGGCCIDDKAAHWAQSSLQGDGTRQGAQRFPHRIFHQHLPRNQDAHIVDN